MKKQTKKRILFIGKILFGVYVYIMFVSIGFLLGMVYQQVLITQEVSKVLSYADIEINVDFNATKFSEELNRTFIPAWKQAFNETLNKEVNK